MLQFGFETDRLNAIDVALIVDQPALADEFYAQLPLLLTRNVLKTLPPHFSKDVDLAGAEKWTADRLAEGELLALRDKQTAKTVGLLFLFVLPLDNSKFDLRIGYLFNQNVWGQGLASELIKGFVEHCRSMAQISSIAGGVETDNIASARVLEKAGFTSDEAQSSPDVAHYHLEF
ncbi:GNAT family N-acetyltransferase [Maritalea sp.]|uniref:GNAT family N-acetyltransferase n=1 Tax=Maritalea sp. TaxID=2003361 RepID=UPI003EF7A1F0